MKKNKHLRNLVILFLMLSATIYGTVFLVERFGITEERRSASETTRSYLRSMQMQLYGKLQEKNYAESEIFIRRILKLDPGNVAMQRIAGKIYYHNGKLNEAENVLRNLLMRNPGDIICRNNYGMVLLAKKQPESFRELLRACNDSGRTSFIAKNLYYAVDVLKLPKMEIPENSAAEPLFTSVPLDAITAPEEDKR